MRLLDHKHRKFRSRALAVDLEILRSFCIVAAVGNVTRASVQLGRSQSTVSSHIARLSDVYGGVLFERIARGVCLTNRGYTVLAMAEKILETHAKTLSTLDGSSLSGELRIGLMDDYAIEHFPKVLKAFGIEHPNLDLRIEIALSAALHQSLENGQLDICVLRRRPPRTCGQLLSREQLVWVSKDSNINVDKNGQIPLIVFDESCLYRTAVIEALENQGRSYRIVATSSSFAGVIAPCAAGFGVTVLAYSTVPANLKIVEDRHLLPPLPKTEVAVTLASPPSPAALILERVILKHAQEARVLS